MLQDMWSTALVRPLGSDKKIHSHNQEFAKTLSGWTFQELGVVKVNEVEHRLKDDEEANPSIYRVKNEIVSWNASIL
jgi:oligosaccharyltransferase complex subunit beta